MNKQLFFLFFLLLSAPLIYAQTGTINGVVLQDNAPFGVYGTNDVVGIPNIIVVLKATNNNTVPPFQVATTTSDANGNYTFGNLAPDFYEVVLPNSPNGYVGTYGTSNSVTIVAGITQNLKSGYKAACSATVGLGNDIAVCKGLSASITATPNTFASYLWSNGATTPSINVTPSLSTSYSVTATDANGCVGKDTIAVTVLDTSKFITEIRLPDTSAFLSCTNKDAIIKAQPDGVVPVAGFTWNTGSTVQFITVQTPGTYNVSVTAANGCVSRGSFDLIQNLTPPANVNILKLPNLNVLTCNITNIVLEASSTTPGAEFKWSTGQTNTSINAALPNTYTLTVTNPINGCTATTSAAITQNLTGPSVFLTPANPTLPCLGGSVALSANIVPNAEYNWVGRNNFTNNLTATTSGVYTLEVKDLASGCITTKTINVTQPSAQPISLGADKTICKGTSTSFSTTPNTFASYLWSNGATTPSINVGPSVSTAYSVIATDASGCVSKDTVALTVADTANFALTIRADTASFLSCINKNIVLNAQPDGVVPVSNFAWNTGATSPSITTSASGIYSVTLTTPNGCVSRGSINVTQNVTQPNISVGKTPNTTALTCSTSSIALQGASTTPSALYAWSNGATTSAIAATTAGTYTLTVTDPVNGCTATNATTITQSVATFTVNIAASSPSLPCGGGSVVLTASASIGNVSYRWINQNNTTNTLTVTTAGTYEVEVTDITTGCKTLKSITITQPAGTQSVSLGADKTICKGTTTSLATTPNTFASYLWSNGATTPTINVGPSVSTAYSVIATDANGCIGKDTIVVNTLDTAFFIMELRPDTSAFLSCTNKDVILKAQPDGIVPVANFAWSTGANAIQFITPQTPGIYSVTVTANNGCESKKSFNVIQNLTPPNISVLKLPNTNVLTCNITGIILEGASTTPAAGLKWSTGETNSSITAATPATYTLTATDPTNGCTSTLATTITQNFTSLNVNILPANPVLPCGGGSVTLTANILPNVSYNWVGRNNGTNTLIATAIGTYTLEVTDLATGCKTVKTITVTQPATPSFSLGADKTICKGTTATLSTTPNTFASYLWSNGATTSTINVTPSVSTSYSVTATDANGCIGKDTIVVNTLDTAFFIMELRPDTSAFLSCTNKDVILKAQPDGIVPVANFAWNTGANAIQFITPQTPGIYSVTVTANNGCESKKSFNVIQNLTPPNISVLKLPNTNVLTCNITGIILEGASTTPASGFKWSTGETNSSITASTPATYTLTVTDPTNGCTSSLATTITQNFTSLNVNILPANPSLPCGGGSVTLTANVLPNVSYNWVGKNNGTNTLIATAVGTYTLEVTDLATGCKTVKTITVTQPATPSFSLGADKTICKGTTATLSTTPNTFASYLWSNGATTSTINVGPSVSTAYSVIATDTNGCIGKDTIVVNTLDTAFFIMELRPDTSAFLSCTNKDVILKAQPDGIVPVANFAWSTGANAIQFITPQTPGIYSVTVTANNGCESKKSFNVIQNLTPPNISVLKLPNTNVLTCNITGIILEGASTTPAAGFKWSTGETNSSITASTPATYTLTVTDPTNGCTSSLATSITQNFTSLNVNILPANPVLPCGGGSVTLTANVLPNVSYNWVGRNNGTNTLIATAIGTYTLEVTDLATGCKTVKTITVTQPATPSFSLGADKTICKGTTTSLSTTPNTFASYLWSNGATTPTINVGPSVSTAYSVIATDANGCIGKDTIVVNTLDTAFFIMELRPDTSAFLSCTNKDVILKAQPDGIVPVANFAWSTGANAIQFITPQTPGIYSVTVTANNGCESKKSFNVIQNLTPPNISVLKLPNTNVLTCNITGIVLEGASTTPAAGFKWSTGQTNSSITAATPATYTLTVTDPTNGCTSTLATTITQNFTSLNVNILPANPTLPCGGGSVTLTANVLPNVSYNWVGRNNGTNTLIATAIGTYTLEVTDLATGCKTARIVTVTQPVTPTVSLGADKTMVIGTSTTLTTVPNTFAAYLWSNGATTPTINVTPSLSTTYSVIATDAGGCVAKDTVVVNVTTPPTGVCNVTVTTVIKDMLCNNANDGKITVTAIGGVAPYTYRLNNGTPQTSNVFSNLSASLNTLTVRDNNGCEVVKYGQNINNPSPITIQTPSVQNIACNGGNNGKITFFANGGYGSLLYSIDGGVTFKGYGIFDNLVAGAYSLVVKDANNCQTSPLSILLTQPAAISFTTENKDAVCNNDASGSIKVKAIGGVGALSFSKDYGTTYQTDSIFRNLLAGTFNIKVRDLSGCQSVIKTVTIAQPNAISFQINKTDPICFGGNNGKIVVNNPVGGSNNGYKFSKDNGATWQNNKTFDNLSAGVYYIRVRDGVQCVSNFVVVSVNNPTKVTFEIVKQDVTCGYTNNGIITFRNINGGAAPLGYSLNNGGSYRTDPMFTNLTAGNYQALVKDNTGCISETKPVSIINTCPPTSNLSRRNPQLSKTIPMLITEMIPNPVEDNLAITVYSIVDKETEFQFFDMFGRVIKTEKRKVEQGYNTINFDCYELAGGVYQIITVGSYPRGVDYRFLKL
jgi:large repetitive protein